MFILPDRMIIKGKKGWGAVDYSEWNIGVANVIFIESGGVPRDAQIVGHTWQFVNKNGTADKRFKNNLGSLLEWTCSKWTSTGL